MAKPSEAVREAGQALLDQLTILKVDASKLPKLTRKGENIMPSSDIQKFLDEEKKRAERKQELIKQLLDERDAKIAEYDDQLALLGYNADPVASLSGGGTKPGRPKGRQMSDETKAKMRAAQQARWAAKKSGSAS